eukprot:14353771-Alexandrium_andersonii.AAC.2
MPGRWAAVLASPSAFRGWTSWLARATGTLASLWLAGTSALAAGGLKPAGDGPPSWRSRHSVRPPRRHWLLGIGGYLKFLGMMVSPVEFWGSPPLFLGAHALAQRTAARSPWHGGHSCGLIEQQPLFVCAPVF